MLSARVIPCLDVKDGRVVKGINFVDLIDAHGDGAVDVGSCPALKSGDVSQGDNALR